MQISGWEKKSHIFGTAIGFKLKNLDLKYEQDSPD